MMIDSTYDLNSHTLSLPLLLPPSLVDSPPLSHPPFTPSLPHTQGKIQLGLTIIEKLVERDTTQRVLSVRYTPTDPIPVPYIIAPFPDHVVLSIHEQVYITRKNRNVQQAIQWTQVRKQLCETRLFFVEGTQTLVLFPDLPREICVPDSEYAGSFTSLVVFIYS